MSKNNDFDEQAYQQYYQQFYNDPSQTYQQQYYQQYQNEAVDSKAPPPPPPEQPPPPPPPEHDYNHGNMYYDPNTGHDPHGSGGYMAQNYYPEAQNPYYDHSSGYYSNNQYQGPQNNYMGKNFVSPGGHSSQGNYGGGHSTQRNFKAPQDGGHSHNRPHPNLNNSRTLYIGNLPADTNEDEIRNLLSTFGAVEALKIVWSRSCAFVKMADISCATTAHQSLDQYNLRGRSLKLGWGKDSDFAQQHPSGGHQPQKRQPQNANSNPPNRILWLGNVTSEVQPNDIIKAFSVFGEIETVKLLNERSCAFVTFMQIEDATRAKEAFQGGTPFGHMPLRINYGKLQSRDSGPDRRREPANSGHPSDDSKPSLLSNLAHKPPQRQVRIGHLANFAGNLPFPPCPTEPEVADGEVKELIIKTADFVAKNGFSFEQRIRDLERMVFLKPDHPNNDYYRFLVWTKRHPDLDPAQEYEKWKEEVIQWKKDLLDPPQPTDSNPSNSGTDNSGDIVVKLKEKLQGSKDSPMFGSEGEPLGQASEIIEKVKGRINIKGDLEELNQKLKELNTDKDTIKGTKNWIKERPHITPNLPTAILTYISTAPDPEVRIAYVYLIHDLLTSAVRDREKKEEMDLYASSLLPKLGQILFHAFRKQSKDNQEQIREVLKVWEDKMVYTSEALDNIEKDMGVSVIFIFFLQQTNIFFFITN